MINGKKFANGDANRISNNIKLLKFNAALVPFRSMTRALPSHSSSLYLHSCGCCNFTTAIRKKEQVTWSRQGRPWVHRTPATAKDTDVRACVRAYVPVAWRAWRETSARRCRCCFFPPRRQSPILKASHLCFTHVTGNTIFPLAQTASSGWRELVKTSFTAFLRSNTRLYLAHYTI